MIYARTFRKVLISSTFPLAGCFPVAAAASQQNESLDCGGKLLYSGRQHVASSHHLLSSSLEATIPQIKIQESGGFGVRLSA